MDALCQLQRFRADGSHINFECAFFRKFGRKRQDKRFGFNQPREYLEECAHKVDGGSHTARKRENWRSASIGRLS